MLFIFDDFNDYQRPQEPKIQPPSKKYIEGTGIRHKLWGPPTSGLSWDGILDVYKTDCRTTFISKSGQPNRWAEDWKDVTCAKCRPILRRRNQ